MAERKIGVDYATLDAKILVDDDKYLVMPAVIASEIVHEYDNGMAYKPADELEKAAWTAEGRWVKILSHPESMLLEKASDIHGRIEEPRFVKDLIDPKTKRPCRKGIRANVKWFKDKVPADVLSKIRSGALKDVSIGFTYEEDKTPGEWEGQKYDYVQRNLFLDHLAAPIEKGRCPGPICGIAVDSIIKAGDPWEETEEYIRSGHKEAGETCRTITISEEEGIKAIYCKYGEEWDIQSYLFSKEKEWTMEKAKNWFEKHKDSKASDIIAEANCDLCKEIKKVGLVEASKRLLSKYGQDITYVVKGESKPEKSEDTEDLIQKSDRVFKELASRLQEK